MKTRNLITLTFFLLLTSWVALVLTGINAAYLLEVNASRVIAVQPQSWMSFIMEENRLITGLVHIEWKLWPLYALYWAPMLAILLAHKSKYIQYFTVITIIILLLLDLRQLLLFEGGDRKGCEFCFIWWLLHSVAGAVVLTVGGLAGLLRIVNQPRVATTYEN